MNKKNYTIIYNILNFNKIKDYTVKLFFLFENLYSSTFA